MSRLRFSAVVGLDEAKAALLYAAVEPRLGGVLLRGEKGSAKTTLARGLAALLPGEAPFVELPLGATEERVLGSLDLPELLTAGTARFRPGLLAAADGGVLYVDEINLLADHLVDALLDVAVSGVNRVERDGLSHTHPARFVLVGSMNPEEGELRPQLLDRFGLAAEVTAPREPAPRAEAVRRQLEAERPTADEGVADDEAEAADRQWRDRVAAARAREVTVPDEVVERASRLALEVEAEGLRADLMLCRAAAAAAALDGRSVATLDDVRAVAALVLAHRRRRRPFDEPGISPDELSEAWDASGRPEPADDDGHGPPPRDRHDRAGTERAGSLDPPRRQRSSTTTGGFGRSEALRGRFVREAPFESAGEAAIDPRGTAVALATRRAATGDDTAPIATEDLRGSVHERRATNAVLFVVDASASMGVERRMAATKAAVLGLLGDAYRRRGTVGLVTFRGDGAEVVLRPTGSVEVARARLAELETGGRTPLAAGLDTARSVVTGLLERDDAECTVVVVTDGRATVGEPDPVSAARLAFDALSRTGARLLVIDTETGPARLSLAAELAHTSGADYRRLDPDGDNLEAAVRGA